MIIEYLKTAILMIAAFFVCLLNYRFCKASKFLPNNYKSLVNLLKVVGVGKAHNTFSLRNFSVAKQLAVWRLEQNGESLKCDSNKKNHSLYGSKINISLLSLF